MFICDIMDKKWVILLLIIICGIICFVYMTTPELTVDNVHAKKYVETTKYTYSGEVKKSYYIEHGYNITQNKALVFNMHLNLRLFDKNGNLLDENSFDFVDTEISEYNHVIGVTEDVFKKADTIQFIFYKERDDGELYNVTIKINKGDGELIEVDDTPSPTHHRELTEREIIEMDAEAWAAVDSGETYWGHDVNGNLKKYR